MAFSFAMTTPAPRSHRLPLAPLAAACVAIAGLVAAASAQVQPPQTAPPPAAAAPSSGPADSATPAQADRLFDLDFVGGTVGHYAEALRQAAPGVNVIVMPEAADVSLPPIRLSQVTARTAVRLLEQQFHGGTPRLDISESDSGRGPVRGSPAFVISARKPNGSPTDPNSAGIITEIESLAWLLGEGQVAADVVLQAVEVAVRATGLEERTTLAYHEPTKLLMVTGPERAVRATQSVISALEPRRATADPALLKELRAKLDAQEMQSQRMLVEAETRASLLRSTLERREAEVTTLQERLLVATIEQRAARGELEQAKAAAEARAEESTLAMQRTQVLSNERQELQARIARLEQLLRANNIRFD